MEGGLAYFAGSGGGGALTVADFSLESSPCKGLRYAGGRFTATWRV